MLGRLWTKPWDDTIYVDAAWLFTLAGDFTNARIFRQKAGTAFLEYDLLRCPERKEKAWNAYQRRQYELAATNFLKVAHTLTNDGISLMMAGKAFANLGQSGKSELLLRKAILRTEGQADCHIELAKWLEQHDKKQEALGHYYKGLSLGKQDSRIWEAVAQIHSSNREFGESARAWMKAFQTSKKGKSAERSLKKAAQMACLWASQDPEAAKKTVPLILRHLDRNDPNYKVLKKFMEAKN
jgi:tetratricopeptide (TPR) repeat protein